MKYKGYELMRAIKEGKIKEDTKFKANINGDNIEIIFNGEDLRIFEEDIDIFEYYSLKNILNSNFTEIEEIKDIEELKFEEVETVDGEKVFKPIRVEEIVEAINSVIKAVNELRKGKK